MKIVMACINPLFADRVIGGSTKHLRRIAEHLGDLGHTVSILCTRRGDSAEPMRWHPNVTVTPAFRFKQPFPLPYDIPAFRFAHVIQTIADELADADRLYLHDGEILFPALCGLVPSIVSLRDCAYPETMLGSFLFQADAMIPLNDYCKRVLLATAGRFLVDLPQRVRVIPNGFDWSFFKPTPPSRELLSIIGIDPSKHAVILHPHRPETGKGLKQTIETVDRLVHKHAVPNIKVLIPRWFDAGLTPELIPYLTEIEGDLERRGLKEQFVFHDWLPQRLMPEYYSLGRVTLVLGSFVEAFGNSAYESLGCGTPAIVSRVGSNRELLPDDLLAKVHFDDNETAAELAAEILRSNRRTSPATLDFLRTHYGIEQQCAAYADVILNATKQPPMRYRFQREDQRRFRLGPWCESWDDNVYHDFLATTIRDPRLARFAVDFPNGATESELQAAGIEPDRLARWRADGYIDG